MAAKQINILLLDGESTFACAVATCLSQKSDVRLHVLSNQPRSPVKFSRHCASYHFYDVPEEEKRIQVITEVLRKVHADIALPTNTPVIRLVAAHRDAWPTQAVLTPIPDREMLEVVADKWRLAGFLHTHGLPHPNTRWASAADGGPASLANLRFPVLLKPRDGANGQDILRFDAPEVLAAHLQTLGWETSRFIIQEFLEGDDIDCSVLCHRGQVLAYTIQCSLLPSGPAFGPSHGIAFVDNPPVLALARQVMSAFNWSGVAHIDLRVMADGTLQIIEINPRYWGSLLGSLAAGINFPVLSCLTALGIPFAQPCPIPSRFVIKHRFWKPFPSASRHVSDPALADLRLQESIWRYTFQDPLPDLYTMLARQRH